MSGPAFGAGAAAGVVVVLRAVGRPAPAAAGAGAAIVRQRSLQVPLVPRDYSQLFFGANLLIKRSLSERQL